MAAEEEEGVRSFATVLLGIDYGNTQRELSVEFNDLCKRLRAEAVKHDYIATGKMQVTIEVACNGRGEMSLQVTDKATVKKRKPDPSSAWMTKDGNVIFESPRQLTIGEQLKEVVAKGSDDAKDVHADEKD